MNIRLELESDGSVPGSLDRQDAIARPDQPGNRHRAAQLRAGGALLPRRSRRRSTSACARCYHAEWDAETGDFVLLMEDLAPARQGNQLTGCDADQARTAVLELAKLHGPRWGDPTLADIEWLSRRARQRRAAVGDVVGDVPARVHQHLRPLPVVEATGVIERFGQTIVDWVNDRDPPNTVTHGDYRLDNLMFGTAEGGPPIRRRRLADAGSRSRDHRRQLLPRRRRRARGTSTHRARTGRRIRSGTRATTASQSMPTTCGSSTDATPTPVSSWP